jgi:putative hemolysin
MKMKKWVVKWLMQRQMRKRGFAGYEPYVFFEMQQGDYQLKIAKTDEEVLECLELRKKVFGDELGAQIKNQVDWDGFDVYFDHLYVRDLKSRQVVGTYRLRYSKANEACYTQQEFYLGSLSYLSDSYLELGRACIHPDFRQGSVMSLLWRGIAEYMEKTGSQFLIGCSSVNQVSDEQMAMIWYYFMKKGYVWDMPLCMAKDEYAVKHFDRYLAVVSEEMQGRAVESLARLVPGLLHSYLKMGAKIASYPAWDKEFGCFDFVTVLKKEDLRMSARNRFLGRSRKTADLNHSV